MKGFIYKLESPNYSYYGSTTMDLKRRYSSHKHDAIYTQQLSSAKLFEDGEVKMSKMATLEFDDKKTLKALERYFIENFECINKNIPNRESKEYEAVRRKDPKRIEYRRKYYGVEVKCPECNKTLKKSSLHNHVNKFCRGKNELVLHWE